MSGRPRFEPTPEQRELVRTLSSIGVQQENICRVIKNRGKPIDAKTLRLHFREELDEAELLANAAVGRSLFRFATDPRGGMKAVVSSIFWMKCRAGWRETANLDVRTEHTLNTHEVDARLDRLFGSRSMADVELQRIAFDGSLPTDKKN
jgi:hypothetical protein